MGIVLDLMFDLWAITFLYLFILEPILSYYGFTRRRSTLRTYEEEAIRGLELV